MDDGGMLSGETPSLIEDALAVLRAVFNSIPTFWGTTELASVFQLYYDTLALGSDSEIGSFARRVASKAPTAVLFSTYFETWPSISCAQAGVSSTWVYSSPASLRIISRRNTWLVILNCSGEAFVPRLGRLCSSTFVLRPKHSSRDLTYGINAEI
jgi:hypothetical protein